MQSFRNNKLLLRLVVLFAIQLMIKGFDFSFGGVFSITWRGLVFTFFFTFFWLLVWYGAEVLNNKIQSLKQIPRLILNLCYGFGFSVLTNVFYRLGDVHLFGNDDLWKDISFANPELSVSLLMFYLLLYSVNEFYQSNLKRKEGQLRSEQLAKENLLAQYQSLKAHIEPHFLFNSLSVLSSLLHTDTVLASEFIDKLSKTLRYVIEKSDKVLVPLGTELEVVNDYYFLLKTRYQDTIQLHCTIDSSFYNEYFVPPTSVQTLIENAVKHNKQSDKHPLIIEILWNTNSLIIKNKLFKRTRSADSLGTGLTNLSRRFELITDQKVLISETKDVFQVELPLLNRNQYESINY